MSRFFLILDIGASTGVEEIGSRYAKAKGALIQKARLSTDAKQQKAAQKEPPRNKEVEYRDAASQGTVDDGDLHKEPPKNEKKDISESDVIHNSAKGYGEN